MNLFKGLWSKQWLSAHATYCEENKLPHAENWTVGVTHLCWTMWLKLWGIRNGHHHGIEQDDKTRRNREKWIYKLKDLYHKKSKTLAMDQDIYRNSLEEHLTESTFKIKTWVTMNAPLIRLSMKEKREKEKSYDIRKYYARRK